MKFLYRYQDHDGHLSEGEVAAPSQSDAYSLLRKQGIRPMKVWPAPGLANRLAALGKRGWSIIVLCALCLVLGAVALRFARRARPSAVSLRSAVASGALSKNQTSSVDLLSPPTFSSSSLSPAPRQQLPPIEILLPNAQGTRHKAQGTSPTTQGTRHKAQTTTFRFASERTLAAFARPGDLFCLTNTPRASRSARDSRAPVDAGPRPRQTQTQPVLSSTSTLNFNSTTLPAEGTRHNAQGTLSDLPDALRTPLTADPADTPDAVTLKRIVVGLKNEVRISLAAGISLEDTIERLVTRQQMEADYRASILQRVEKGTLTRDRANATLRTMGLAPIQ